MWILNDLIWSLDNAIDDEAVSEGIADVAVILDTSIFSPEDEVYMKRVSAALTNELEMWRCGE